MKIFLRYLFVILSTLIVLILIWASIDKLIKLQIVSENPDAFGPGTIEYFYKDHLFLAYLHIVPGLIFLLLGGYQLIPFFRRMNYRIHRRIGSAFLILSVLIFITAIILALFYPFGNWLETLTTVIFGIFLLFCVYKAYQTARSKRFPEHRKWVIRIYFVALAVSTIRGILALLSAVYDIPIEKSFGVAFLIAFVIHAFFVEVYLKYLIGKFRY